MATIDNPEGKLEKMSDEVLKNLLFDKNDGKKLSLDDVWEDFPAEDRTADNEKRIQALCEELCRLGVYSQVGEGYVLTQAVIDFTDTSTGDPDLKAILEYFASNETRLRQERESIIKDIRDTVLASLLCEPSGESAAEFEKSISNVSKSKGMDLTKEEATKMVTSLQADDSILLENERYYAYRFAPSVLEKKRKDDRYKAMVADLRTAIDNLPVEGMSVTDFEAFVIPANAVYQRPSNDERRQLIESAIDSNAVIFEGERFYQPGTEPSSPTQPDEVRKKFLVSQGKKFNVAVDSLRQAFTAGDAENELSPQTISRIGPALQMARESLSAMRKHPEFAADAKIEKVAKMLEYADYQDRFLGDFYGRPKTDKERADFRGRRELLVAGLEKVSDYTRDIFEVSFDIPVTDKQEPIIEHVKARVAVSSERFTDRTYHQFGDLEKEGYAGVFYNFSSEQDAFAVDGKAIAVADGMGSYSQSGTLSRLMAKKLAAAANKVATDEEFRKLFSRASLEKLMDKKEYDAALDEVFKDLDPKHAWRGYKATRRDNASETDPRHESYTTFSVLRDSDDGKQIYCAMLGDSPIIVIDRNDAGEITGWQLLNEEVIITNANGGKESVAVTDKNYLLDEIAEELDDKRTSGIGFSGLGEPQIPRDIESYLRFVKINRQPNRMVVVASDALTKLLYKGSPVLELADLEHLVSLPETELLEYLKAKPNARFAVIHTLTGALDKDQLRAALNGCKNRIAYLKEIIKDANGLWNPDGTLNILNVLNANPKVLQIAKDDFTFVTVAAGEQVVNPGTQRATSTPPPVGGTGTAGSSVDITTDAVAVKSAELTAAGNDLGDAYMQVSEVMRRLQSGRPVSPDDWKNAKQGLQTFLKSAAAMVAGGLKLSGDAQDAQTYLSGLNRLEDSAEIKRAMDAIEVELRTQYQGAAVAGASPDTIAVKRAALTAAGNDLGDAYAQVDEVMRRLQSGRPVPADELKEVKQNLWMFLDSAAAMVAGGLTLSPDAQAARSYLDGLDRLDDWAKIKRAMDTIETDLRIQYQGAESLKFDNQLETVAALRAQATIVKSILDAYEKVNGGALSPVADLLVRRVAREAFEKSKTEDLSSDNSFVLFLNQIQEAAENGNILRLLDRESGQRESVTLKYIIERLVGALNESIKKLYKDRSSKIGGRYEDAFNREEIDTYDSFLAVGKWLAELKDEKNIDPKLRSQLVTELEKTERNLAEKLEKLRGQRYPSATPSIGRAPAEPTSFSASFDLGGKKALGGMTSSVGIDATAAGAFAAMKPEVRKPRQNTAIDFKFKNGKYTLPMAEAFANDVFYDFFKKFDEQRNPGEEFDAADESHHERYEKAVEGYRLWLEALGVFTKQAKEIIQQDLGIKADPADFVAFEDELEQLVIEDTQKVRGMIDKISEYNNLEEDEARKENELIDLGGFEKLKIQVDELQILRQEKKFEADALIARLTDFAKSRSPYSRAREFKNRTTWQKAKVPQNEGFWAKLKRKASDATGSLMWKFKGLLTFKESRNLEKELQKTYGMDIDTAAEYFPELAKLEERMQAQTEAAIREYERIEKMYHELKSKVATVERAQQEKDLISNRFNQLRLGIFSNTQAFKTVARLTAGRSRDIIKGMLDGAGASDEKLGEAVKKSEVQLEGLRRAANFKFGGDRYADLPEITETLGAEGSVIAEADSVITEAVKKRIQKVVEQTTTVNNQGTLLIRKAFLAYGKRGYEIGEQVLSEAIKKAKDASNGRRANQLQALLFELRALKG